MKRAIVLSGGGSKGSYQIGVWKALRQLHISYDIVTGTSVGALNGALMTQETYYQALKLWQNLNFGVLFDTVQKEVKSPKEIIELYGKSILLDGGMNVSKLERLLKSVVRPERIYRSPIDFGLVTYNMTKGKQESLVKHEIEEHLFCDYLMASATCFPAFQKKTIKEDDYIDGGYYDNLPINLAIDMGATEIIAVDLKTIGVKRKLKDETIDITYLTPRNNLAPFLIFDSLSASRGIAFGYNDTMKYYHRLEGDHFTFKKNHLTKHIEKNKARFVEELKKQLSSKEESIAQDLWKIVVYKRLLSKKDITKELIEVIEYLGSAFDMEESTIYSMRKFQHDLMCSVYRVKRLSRKEVEQGLKKGPKAFPWKKDQLILYFFHCLLTSLTLKERNRTLRFALLFPYEYLAALYLYSVRGNHGSFFSF